MHHTDDDDDDDDEEEDNDDDDDDDRDEAEEEELCHSDGNKSIILGYWMLFLFASLASILKIALYLHLLNYTMRFLLNSRVVERG